MKAILLSTVISVCILFSCTPPKKHLQTFIDGSIKDVTDTTLIVSYSDSVGYQEDIIEVRNGKFEWEKDIPFSTGIVITVKGGSKSYDSDAAVFWTTPGIMKLELTLGNLKDFKLSGSPNNDIIKKWKDENQEVQSKLMSCYKIARNNKELSDSDSIMMEIKSLTDILDSKRKEFIAAHPNMAYSASELYTLVGSNSISDEEAEKFYSTFTGDASICGYTKRIKQDLYDKTQGIVGGKAAMIKGKDINNNDFDMSNFLNNNYVIVDFWASWCRPCRASNPHMKALHEKYKKDGLKFVFVADNDGSPNEWKKAVNDDEIGEFNHILRGWGGMKKFFVNLDWTSKYNVNSLPTKFLIDKNGIIVNRYGDDNNAEDSIDNDLKKIFGH